MLEGMPVFAVLDRGQICSKLANKVKESAGLAWEFETENFSPSLTIPSDRPRCRLPTCLPKDLPCAGDVHLALNFGKLSGVHGDACLQELC